MKYICTHASWRTETSPNKKSETMDTIISLFRPLICTLKLHKAIPE